MPKIFVSGACGHMGHNIARLAAEDSEIEIVAGFDICGEKYDSFPIYSDYSDFKGEADVLIDFSSPAALSDILKFGISRNIPLILCTTGYSAEQLDEIKGAAAKIPVFRSGNMSLGINLMSELIKRACTVLGDKYDVEIVEKHHRRKVDAPSGTAVMLADAAASALPYKAQYTYDRESRRSPRIPNEIGISSVRGGTIVGEHEIIFAGTDEVIEIKHTAFSRDVFANGALKAAKFMAGKTAAGMYDMNDVLAAN